MLIQHMKGRKVNDEKITLNEFSKYRYKFSLLNYQKFRIYHSSRRSDSV